MKFTFLFIIHKYQIIITDINTCIKKLSPMFFWATLAATLYPNGPAKESRLWGLGSY